MSSPSSAISTPLDEQLNDARLLGREELVPQRVELQERVPNLRLGDAVVLRVRAAPGPNYDLRAGGRRRGAGR